MVQKNPALVKGNLDTVFYCFGPFFAIDIIAGILSSNICLLHGEGLENEILNSNGNKWWVLEFCLEFSVDET